MDKPNVPFVRRVVLKNYKSIRHCDVTLGPLTLLVGLNGSGKSNFLDALRFLAEALRTDLQSAVDEREEVARILHRPPRGATTFSIDLTLNLPDDTVATYGVSIGQSKRLALVAQEWCRVCRRGGVESYYETKHGYVTGYVTFSTQALPPLATPDQLYLRAVSGVPEFQDLYRLLRNLRFFNIDPEQIRLDLAAGKPARELMRNGRGALFAFHRLREAANQRAARLEEYLRVIVPGLQGIKEVLADDVITDRGRVLPAGSASEASTPSDEPKSLLFGFPKVDGSEGQLGERFGPRNVSDGTLRAFGVLLALFQAIGRPDNDPMPLVGIEEPEAAVHPAAAGVLWDALCEASHFTQVIVTTHSPDLLERKEADPEFLLVAEMIDGESMIGPPDEASKSIVRDRLLTAGELLRQNQLRTENAPPVPAESDATEA